MILFDIVVTYVANGIGKVLASLLEIFIDSFIKWIATLPAILHEAITGRLIGAKTFLDTSNDEEISDNYALRSDGQWELTSLSRRIRRDEIPDEYRNKQAGRYDVTDELEMSLR